LILHCKDELDFCFGGVDFILVDRSKKRAKKITINKLLQKAWEKK